MTRFHRLELDQHQQAQQVASTGELRQNAALDERNWMTEADQSRRHGHYESALRYYSRALELDRSLVAAWVGQVQMLILLGECPEAELWSRKALELFRNNGDLLAARSQAFCRNGDLKQAQVACDAALAQQGQSAYGWMVRGELMLAHRDPVEEHCFGKAAQLDPEWLVLLEIALIYLHYHLPAKALTRMRLAVEKAPDQPYCWYQQGVCEIELGLNGPGRKSLGRCRELVPNHVDAGRLLLSLDSGGHSVRGFFRRLFRRS